MKVNGGHWGAGKMKYRAVGAGSDRGAHCPPSPTPQAIIPGAEAVIPTCPFVIPTCPFVIPAKVGIQKMWRGPWIPASAGLTKGGGGHGMTTIDRKHHQRGLVCPVGARLDNH